mgnify:CR=1 FL=1
MTSVVLGADGMTIEEAISYITHHVFIADDEKVWQPLPQPYKGE